MQIGDLQNGENSFSFSAASYSQRSYTVTLSNLSQSLTVYLAPNTTTTTFTIADENTGDNIESVLTSMYRIIGGVWTTVESRYSDVTGRAVFNYLPNTKYRFVFAKNGYENKIFVLNPVVFTSYDVSMKPTVLVNDTSDFDGVVVLWTDPPFYDGEENSFSFLTMSPSGSLVSYAFNLTYPGGSTGGSGTNAIGSQINRNFNISGATAFDYVTLSYSYTTAIGGTRDFSYQYPIVVGSTNSTFAAMKANLYGMGLFERIFIMVIIVLFFVGIATLVGQPIPGMAFGLLIMGYMAFTGFVPVWSVGLSIAIGVLLLSTRGGS